MNSRNALDSFVGCAVRTDLDSAVRTAHPTAFLPDVRRRADYFANPSMWRGAAGKLRFRFPVGLAAGRGLNVGHHNQLENEPWR